MSAPYRHDLDPALADLEATFGRGKHPTRYHARAVLIALGERLIAGAAVEVDRAVRRIGTIVARDVAAWRRVVSDELVLACTEHLQSVDPRWLDLPRYDFAYTVAARADLEARLRAAERLELSPSQELLERVAQADLLLAPYLRGRSGEESSN